MDAPATTSADNGTSGGGDGWFKPRKQPSSAPGTEPQGAEPQGTEGRRLAGLRPVGRGTTAHAEAAPQQHAGQAAAEARIGAPQTPAPSEPTATTVLPKLIPSPATAVPPLVSPVPSRSYSDAPHTASEPLQVPAQRTAPSGPPPAEEPRPAFTEAPQPTSQPYPHPDAAPFQASVPETLENLPSDAEALQVPAQDASRPEAGYLQDVPQNPLQPEAAGSFVPDAFRPAADFPRPSTADPLATEPSGTYEDEAPRSAPEPPPSASEPFRAFGSDSLPAAEPQLVAEGSPDAVLIRRTMAAIGEVSDKVTSYFYALLFVRHPDLRPLFPPAMDAQRDRLLKALLTAAEHVDNTPVLVEYLQNLGRGHRKYGTRPEHYPAVGECLIEALAKYAESVWEPETEAAWVRTYTTISQVMIDAAAVDELRAPAWWQAEVVSHELRTQDIAVLTVRPNQPYPFLAGQYASLETPWWPRIWRHYSFASAPRSDGLLSFHVKAVPAGWVSNALVHRAQPGDVVRLGPPAGSMTVDHTRDTGLLCLGGGTGIAPIKALVEDVAEHGTRRRMEVFYGARTDHDLYDIDTMLRLKQSHSWLEVRPVVDKHGLLQLPDAIRTFGPWDEYDAYLSGPVGMIRSGVDALRGVGIPKERIRHDSVAELVAVG
ncbi:globin domain-containing protein [Streptomyces sp. NPDC004539]|uniref:globin domain-containing protein n=1 Tax=Streptomyces sp. NPDC004539 TaxID=3154280 RepID=UPI0033AB1801